LYGVHVFAAQPPRQQVECGRIDRLNIFSPQMNDTVTVDVWTPDIYGFDVTRHFPVIYMHDGQNLFDANTTWNHQAWEMESVMCSLLGEGLIEPAIIVGVHSFPDSRVADLMPQKAVEGSEALTTTLEQVKMKSLPVRGDAYAAFLAGTLKSEIDSLYRTLRDASNTTVMGSSMGGLMSIYTLCEYPDVFGNAICMSTHWIGAPEVAGEFTDAMYRYIDTNLPQPGNRKLYFDHGTATIDAYYGDAEKRILKLLKEKGYGDTNLRNMIDEGAPHEERAWAGRVSVPLLFLLGR
ncbi:MAG: alpha/beta hydrolase, partial [Muribaculaceae bacterium]|nr:alpha/beta hydrolase [Muribaculaceae bacterium]